MVAATGSYDVLITFHATLKNSLKTKNVDRQLLSKIDHNNIIIFTCLSLSYHSRMTQVFGRCGEGGERGEDVLVWQGG